MKKKFDLFNVGGTAFEIGRQVGDLLKEKIPRAIDQILSYDLGLFKRFTKGIALPDGLDLSNENLIAHTKNFVPLFESYCPGVIDEIKGIAETSGLSFEEALLLQIRGEIVYALNGGCTSFALSRESTRERKVYAGQNWDYNIDPDPLVLLRVSPEDGPRYLTMTFAGLTSFMGMNAAGISQFGNSPPRGWCEMGIPHYPIKWRIYRERNMVGLKKLPANTKTIQPGNYTMCDGEGEIADAELTPQGPNRLDDSVSRYLPVLERGETEDSVPI
jgi:isopenicillin-N N-acyltransferase-like protein